MASKEEEAMNTISPGSKPVVNLARKFKASAYAAIVAGLPSSKRTGSRSVSGMRRSKTFMRGNKVGPTPSKVRPATPSDSEIDTMWLELQARGLSLKKEAGEQVDDDDEEPELNELDRLKQLEIIKQFPARISAKRKLRDRLYQNVSEYKSECCSAWKYKMQVGWKKYKKRAALRHKAFMYAVQPFHEDIARIEGHFGSGVGSFFRNMRSLFFANLFIFFMFSLVVVIPQSSFTSNMNLTGADLSLITSNSTDTAAIVLACSQDYQDSATNYTSGFPYPLIDFLQGTGWMEYTQMFYGYYDSESLTVPGTGYHYHLPFAYLITVAVYFLISLIIIIRESSEGYRDRIVSSEMKLKMYCNQVFGVWDYSMNDVNTALVTQKSIWRKLMLDLEEERRANKKDNRTTAQKCRLFTKRFFVNFFVLLCLGGAAYLIYYTTVQTAELTTSAAYTTYHAGIQFLIQYMTSLTISVLNAILPITFKKIVRFEHYSPSLTANMTLFRIVFLKLASLVVLLVSIYQTVTCSSQNQCNVGTGTCTPLECWETYIGQNIYKLLITDFLVTITKVFALETPRQLLFTYVKKGWAQKIGLPEFDIPSNNLSIIYNQTLFWLGAFFSPLIPAIVVLKMLITFYAKEVSLLYNFRPNTVPYRSSQAKSFFMIVLLVAFVLVATCCFYVTYKLPPTRSCGPFRDLDYMFDILSEGINYWPDALEYILELFTSSLALILFFVIALVVLYYMTVQRGAYRDLSDKLAEQLHMEGQDKRFLLEKLRVLEAHDVKSMLADRRAVARHAAFKTPKEGEDKKFLLNRINEMTGGEKKLPPRKSFGKQESLNEDDEVSRTSSYLTEKELRQLEEEIGVGGRQPTNAEIYSNADENLSSV